MPGSLSTTRETGSAWAAAGLVALVAIWLALAVHPSAARGDFVPGAGPSSAPVIEGLDDDLSVVVRASERAGTRQALRNARGRDLMVEGTSLRVEVGAASGNQAARSAIAGAGGETEVASPPLLQALVPVSALRELGRDDAVGFVRAPVPLQPHAVAGEGVGVTNAAAWHGAGWIGQGTTVMVIDIGFQGIVQSVQRGDLPDTLEALDAGCGQGFEGDRHGTATAEIVHEMAPGAHLVVVCVVTNVGIDAALTEARDRGIPITSMSLGNQLGRGDGTNSPGGASVTAARAGGVLPVISAGNEARKHWGGTFVSPDGDSFHDFAPGDEVNNVTVFGGGTRFCPTLRWDEWPSASSSYNIQIRDLSGVLLFEAPLPQPTTLPFRRLCITNSGSTVTLGLTIVRNSGVGTPRLDLFYDGPDGNLEHQTLAGSMGEPATSPSAFSVAAICWQNSVRENYSSAGPTIDGRIEPDIGGQAAVSSVYGPFSSCNTSGFTGTSAAAPHVAGAAALVKGAFPAYNAGQLQAFIEGRAPDLGSPGKDSLTGWGKLDLGAPPQAASSGGGGGSAGAAAPAPPPPPSRSDAACGGVRFRNSKRVPVYARAAKIRFAFRASTRCRVTVFLRVGRRIIGRATALLEPVSGVNPPSRRVTIRINARGRRLLRRPGALRVRLILVRGAAVRESGRQRLVQQTIRLL